MGANPISEPLDKWTFTQQGQHPGIFVLVREGSLYWTFNDNAKILESLNLTMKFEKNVQRVEGQESFSFHADALNTVLHALWKIPLAVILLND